MTAKERPGAPRRISRAATTGAADRVRGFQAVDRALQVLQVLGEDCEGYRLADLGVRTGLPVSTVHRLLTALEQRRFVQFDRDAGRWHVGPQLFAIGASFAQRRNFVATAMPVLRALRDRTRETANLGVADAGEVVVLAQAESREIVRVVSVVGGRVPMINHALGKAILATYDDAEVAALIQRHGMPRVTPTSITRAGDLFEELRTVRASGYALDRGEYKRELRCAAAVVFDAHGEALAAISVSGIVSRIADDRLAGIGRFVADAARDLTIAIGGRPMQQAGS